MRGSSICSFCARMKRGLLYSCVRKEGYNKLVLAQHLDDMAESWMMSAFHNGTSRTMSAAYTIAEVRVLSFVGCIPPARARFPSPSSPHRARSSVVSFLYSPRRAISTSYAPLRTRAKS